MRSHAAGRNQCKALHRCTDIAKVIHHGMTAAQDTNATTILSERTKKVTPLIPEQRAAFRERAQPAVREWVIEQIGEKWPTNTTLAFFGAFRGKSGT